MLTSRLFVFGEVVRHVLQGDDLPPDHFVLLFQKDLLLFLYLEAARTISFGGHMVFQDPKDAEQLRLVKTR